MLLAYGWLAPSPASADCAHYVTSLTHPPADLTRFEALLHTGPPVLEAEALPFRDAAGRPARCPGGICSKRPELPVIPMPDPPQVKEWGTFLVLLPPLDAGSIAFPLNDDHSRPLHHGLPIFHPPKACAPLLVMS
ncbi:MAG TPA: hypothetical protein VGZ22_13210 [Isosphaeraceae bacterium]|jgi:hypothetical protein|nr:hypothetical protein [Isosphaeraceae bacterium]